MGSGEIDEVNEKSTGDRVAEGMNGLMEGVGGRAVTKSITKPPLSRVESVTITTKAKELVVVKTFKRDVPVKAAKMGEVVELPSKT
jgi:hypothetical protein